MSDAVAYNLRDEDSDKQAVETPEYKGSSTTEDKTTETQTEMNGGKEEKSDLQNGHPQESEFRSPGNGEESSSGAQDDVEALKRDHAPTVEREEDEETQEVTYTAEVGKIPDDSAAAGGGGKMLLMAAHPQLAQDVRAAFAGIPRVKPQWSDCYLKIMIVGESGLGKTTFIKNLLAPYAQDPNMAVNDAPGTEEALAAFGSRPERMCTSVVVNDHSTLTSFHYSVQDTPGYNTLEDARAPIIEYIRRQNRLHCEREQDAKRAGPLHRHPDARVDVALFFVAPHRLRPIDVDFIVELSAWVPVVPIVAKADSMTVEELQEFRKDVREKLGQAGKACRKDLLHAFSEEALDAANARRDVPPFAVVSSTTMDLSVGRFWPVRKYPWGTCEALSSVHSDVGALKRLLFEEGYEELKAATERRYYEFRSHHLIGGDDPDLPIQHGNFVQHAYRAVMHKHSGERRRVKQALGNGLKVIGAAAIFYVGASYALGGQERVRADLEVIQEKGGEAADVLLEKASKLGAVTAEKAQDVGSAVADKVLEKTDVVTDVAAQKTHEVTSRAAWFSRRKGRQLVDAAAEKASQVRPLIAEKASQVKGAVADKFTSEEELERRRLEAEAEEEAARKEAEEAEKTKHRWGPFGLFRK